MTETAIQILLFEDSVADAALLKMELADSRFGPFSVTHVKRLEEGLAKLLEQRFDAVLLDLGLPDSQGLATLERLCKQKPRGTPVVLLTGLDDEVVGLRALREGADEYLVKDGMAGNMRARAVRFTIERKRMNEALAASEERLQLALDAAQMGIFDWDLTTGKVSRTSHHGDLFGLSENEMVDSYDAFEQCVHPDDRAGVKDQIAQSLSKRREYRHEFRVVWPDGSIHWIEARGKVFHDEKDRPVRMLGTVVDISLRKEAEEKARIHEAELAHLSRVSTMGQMASGLAHELNQPLAAILNYATVGLDQVESGSIVHETMLTAIQEIMSETRRAGNIISRLRSFVRKQKPQIAAVVDINGLAEESIRLLEFELRHQGIRPRLEFAANLPLVLVDAVQIEQVLVNLIYNALEAMEDEHSRNKQLTIRSRKYEDGSHVEVAVIDSGPGILPENLARLFQPFFTTKPKGLGMGLNISRSIIESHGGRLMVAAGNAGGMEFSFTLPAAEDFQDQT